MHMTVTCYRLLWFQHEQHLNRRTCREITSTVMLWWMLLRTKTTRNQLGSVVDLCESCGVLRYFRVVRIFSRSGVNATPRYVSDQKWCAGCGHMTRCDPMRYLRPLTDVELQQLSEQQAFAATNPGLQSRLNFIDAVKSAGEAKMSKSKLAELHKIVATLKRFEAGGHNTGDLLHGLDVADPSAGVAHLLNQLRVDEERRAMTDEARALAVGFVIETKGEERLSAIVLALVLAIVSSSSAWLIHTRSLYLDNPTGEAMVVFVNGKQHELAAGANQKIYIEKEDNYRLGWSLDGAGTAQDEFETAIGDEAMYNPGRTGCYWLQIDVYSVSGTQSVHNSESWGPQPIRDLYMFKKVDKWFAPNPEELELSSSQRSARRIAVLHDGDCMRFSACDITVRQKLQTCRANAVRLATDAAVEECLVQAETRCPNAEPPLQLTPKFAQSPLSRVRLLVPGSSAARTTTGDHPGARYGTYASCVSTAPNACLVAPPGT